MRHLAAALVLLLASPGVGAAQPGPPPPHVGDAYGVVRTVKSTQRSSDESSSFTSTDRDTLLERVVGVRDGGVELEFTLPRGATAEDRSRTWQFPARVFKPSHGPLQLLNRPGMEARIDTWLKAAGMTRTACGRWIFTWNAFRIECDPQTVVETLEQFDMQPGDLRDGALYQEPKTLRPAPLHRSAGGDAATFAVELEVDPDAVRRERAEGDVAAAEIGGKPVTLEAALQARAADSIAGTVKVTFDTDAAGTVQRRTRMTDIRITAPDGRWDAAKTDETTEWRRVASAPRLRGH